MKRLTITTLAFSMAFALSLNSNVTAQSGGSFAPPINSGSFSNGPIVLPTQNSGTSIQVQQSGSSGFNPTPFKVKGKPSPTNRVAQKRQLPATKPKTSQPAKPATRSAAAPTSFGRPASFAAQGRTSFGASPIQPTQMTSNEPSGGPSPLPESVDCPISSVHFIEDILLPAREAGEIKVMNFKEGDFVPAGRTIAQIDDENYRLLLEQADMRYQIALDAANDAIATLAAKKKYQVASIEAKKTDRLAGTGSKSASDKMMATYSKEIAFLEVRKAEQDRRKALSEAKLALAQKREVETKIARHTLQSDFDGYVVEVKKQKQEYVQVGEEVLRLARMDRVWVQSVVNTKELNAHELMNRKVTVTIELARGETAEFEGVVKFVGLERQGPELLMVKAEVTNRPINSHWILQPEAEVSMKIHLDNDSSSSIGSAPMPGFTR